jgi:bifunctional non-homologous end joining protein LigD
VRSAALRAKAPKGPQWLHEIKYDGYRVQVHLNKGKKVIAGALDISGQAIIDGEVVLIKDGRTDFSELQAALLLADRTGWSSTPSTCCT